MWSAPSSHSNGGNVQSGMSDVPMGPSQFVAAVAAGLESGYSGMVAEHGSAARLFDRAPHVSH